MPAPLYDLKVITPQGIAYTGQAEHCRIPVNRGTVGVLANHAPYITSSAGGELEIREADGNVKTFQVGPGFFEVCQNQATFLTQSFNTGAQSE